MDTLERNVQLVLELGSIFSLLLAWQIHKNSKKLRNARPTSLSTDAINATIPPRNHAFVGRMESQLLQTIPRKSRGPSFWPSTGDVTPVRQRICTWSTERQSLRNGVADDTTERVAQSIAARQQSLATEQTLRELQTRQREQVLQDRIRTLQAELRQAAEETSLQERRIQLAQTTLARDEQLAKDGFVSAAQVQVRQEELIDAKARLQSAQRTRLALEHDIQALKGERAALADQLKADINQIERNRAGIEQEASENAQRKTVVITAPKDGQVTALGLQVGQSVQAGQALLTITPTAGNGNQLQAHLYAPSHTAGFVKPGQSVYLRYAAYPYQKFGLYAGQITGVSATPFAPNELPPKPPIAEVVVAKYLKLQNADAGKLLDDIDSGLRPAYEKFILQIREPNSNPYVALDNFLGFLKVASDLNTNRQDFQKLIKDLETGGS